MNMEGLLNEGKVEEHDNFEKRKEFIKNCILNQCVREYEDVIFSKNLSFYEVYEIIGDLDTGDEDEDVKLGALFLDVYLEHNQK